MDNQPREALVAFEKFEQWAVAELGADDAAVVQAIARQAWCHARLGHRSRSCALYKRVLDMLRATVGEEVGAYAEIAEHLSRRCGKTERLESTELSSHDAGPHTLIGLPRFHPFGSEMDWTRKLELLEGDARAAARGLGVADPFHWLTDGEDSHDFTIGELLREIGEFELAVDVFTRHERWARETLGRSHNTVVQTLHQLAYCHTALGAFTEACRLKQQVIELLRDLEPQNQFVEVLEREFGERCPPVPEKWLYGLAALWGEEEQLLESTTALETYERWARHEYGAGHRYVADAMYLRAYCLSVLEDDDQACRLYKTVLGMAEELGWGPEPTAEIQSFLSENCATASDEPGKRSAPLGDRWTPPLLPDVQPQLEAIGDRLVELAHFEEAASAYEAAQSFIEEMDGLQEPEAARLLTKRANCHFQLGEDELACQLYRQAVGTLETAEIPDREFLKKAAEFIADYCA